MHPWVAARTGRINFGLQVFALVPGMGSFLTRAPPLLTSLRPEPVPVTNAAPDGSYSTAPSAEDPSGRVSRPDRLYRAKSSEEAFEAGLDAIRDGMGCR